MRSILWWGVWGMVVGIGVLGLRESSHTSLHFLIAMPLLTGALAAAAVRIRHEYHEAMQNAKWLLISSGFFVLSSGILYLRAEAMGPFRMGSAHKAILGATFEMSAREVERAVGV